MYEREKLRQVLIDAGCPEFGDLIIDEICSIFHHPNTNQIAFIWSVEDVLSIDKDLTDEQAMLILAGFEHNHDGSQEAMWYDLKYHVDNFKENPHEYTYEEVE